ncbi:MAG: hypothetical protein Q7S27_01950 [Nanoarchaeota archaeon]|nr:hypothetical protein [Nanoarchaeota archaeon]
MNNENLVELEFGRLQAYIRREDMLSVVRSIGALAEQDIYTCLYEKAIQADYNIAAYISQMKISGNSATTLEERFDQLRSNCNINFPRTPVISLPALQDAPVGGYE